MLFGNGGNNQPRWKPYYTQIVRLYWQGEKPVEIAQQLGCSTATVGTVIHSDQGKAILAELEARTYDSSLEVITLAQALAVQMLHGKAAIALDKNHDARLRNRAMSDILGIAGHTPVHRISVERPDAILEQYKDQTPAQLREALVKLKDHKPNEVGPDGKLVN